MKIEELSVGNYVHIKDKPTVFRICAIMRDNFISMLPHGTDSKEASDGDYICTHLQNLRPIRFDSGGLDIEIMCDINDCRPVGYAHIHFAGMSYTTAHRLQNAHIAAYGEPLSLSGCIIDQPETKPEPEPEPVKDMEYVIKRLDEIVKWFEERGH